MPGNVSEDVEIRARWTGRAFERGARRTERQLEEVARAGRRVGPETRRGGRTAENALRGVGGQAVILQRALAAVGGVFALRAVANLSDSYTNLQNRLKVVTDGAVELERVSQSLLAVSNRSRVSWEATAQIYQRTAAASTELGVSQQQLIDFTETLNQSVIISGATAEEAHGALIQLSQGIASTELRGQELRSVLEQLPFVAQVIADSLGVARGALIKLGESGAISADAILDAFRNAREEIAERFLTLTPTISQSFQVLRNETLSYVGSLNEATGAFGLISQGILGLAANFDTAATAMEAVVILLSVELARRAIPLAIRGIQALTVAVAANPLGALAIGTTTAISLLVGFRDELVLTEDGTVTFGDVVNGTLTEIALALGAVREEVEQTGITFSDVFGGIGNVAAGLVTETILQLESLANVVGTVNILISNLFLSAFTGRPLARIDLSNVLNTGELETEVTEFGENLNKRLQASINDPTILDRAAELAERRQGVDTDDTEETELLQRARALELQYATIAERERTAIQDRREKLEILAMEKALLEEINAEVAAEQYLVQGLVDVRQFLAQTVAESSEAFAEGETASIRNQINIEEELYRRRIDAIDDSTKREQAARHRFDIEHAEVRFRNLGAEEAQVEELLSLYERLSVRQQTEQAAVEHVQRIRLVFGANTGELESAADVAAFAVGRLTKSLQGLSPAMDLALTVAQDLAVAIATMNPFAAAAAGVNLLSGVVRIFRGRAERARQEQERLNQALEESRERTSAWARQLEEFNAPQVGGRFDTQFALLSRAARTSGVLKFVDQFTRTIDEVGARAAIAASTLSRADKTAALTLINNLQTAEEAFARQATGRGRTLQEAISNYQHIARLEESAGTERLRIFQEQVSGFVNLAGIERDAIGRLSLDDPALQASLRALTLDDRRRVESIIFEINRGIGDAEIQSRQQQAERLIEEIEQQHRDVIRAISDREEAARQAALRAVGAQFDLQEAALRASYIPALRGAAGDRSETQLILEQAQRRIEELSQGEEAAGTEAQALVRERFDEARQQAEIIRDGLVGAVNGAIQDLSQTFGDALVDTLTNTFGDLGLDFESFAGTLGAILAGGDLVDVELFGDLVRAAYEPTLGKLDDISDILRQANEIAQNAAIGAGGVDPLERVRGLTGNEFIREAFEAGGFEGFVDAVRSLTAAEAEYFRQQDEAERVQAARDQAVLDATNNPAWIMATDRTLDVAIKLEIGVPTTINATIESGTSGTEELSDEIKRQVEDGLVDSLAENTDFKRAVAKVSGEVVGEAIPEANVTFGG